MNLASTCPSLSSQLGGARGGHEGEHRAHLKAGKVDLGGSSNDVGLVDPTHGDAVDLERAGDEQEAALELLEEDDALAAEATGEEDEHRAGRDRRAQLGRLEHLAVQLRRAHVVRRVEGRRARNGENARGAVRLAADRLGDGRGGLG